MARVHAINILEQLAQEKAINNLTFELGNSQKYIKTIFMNGHVLVNNCQQYNMSKNNHELFEILEANYTCMHDKSMATSKVEKAHARGEYYKQSSTYVKDSNTVEELEKTLNLIKDDIDCVSDNDLKFWIENNQAKKYINSLLLQYSYDVETIKKYHASWNEEKGEQSSNENLLLIAPNRVITKGLYEKIKNVKCRMEKLMGV